MSELTSQKVSKVLVVPDGRFCAIISQDLKLLEVWDLGRQQLFKSYNYDRNNWQYLQCSSDSQWLFYGSQQSKLSYKLDTESRDVGFRNFFKGNIVIQMAMTSSGQFIHVITADRKFMTFSADSLDQFSELVISDNQLCLLEVSADEQTAVVSDETSSLIKIDCRSISNP